MPSDAKILTSYVLAKLDTEPVAKRARLYRALAGLAAPADRQRFETLAAECEALRFSHRHIMLEMERRKP